MTKLYRYGASLMFSLVSFAVAGCGAMTGFFAPQEMSENYALTPGTLAISTWESTDTPVPELIDGDPETTVETARQIIIRLPEKRSIRRIVMRNANYEDVILYIGGEKENEWKQASRIKQNRETTITIDVTAVTDRIRLRIGNTHDDKMGVADGP
ncbi:MAG: hypothetical protein O3A46_11025, partial [Candidatus Poribacteria bacterium]|nr:hypothetical protein [Candidatus Poribacteria bacterium]